MKNSDDLRRIDNWLVRFWERYGDTVDWTLIFLLAVLVGWLFSRVSQ